ncbi:MAG: succinate dehydrogenase, hydrophobic membrane anchor protein [Alphaproteobacteria bacterium]
MSLNTPLKDVRGLGSAKDGTAHFWHQRLTAIALVPLVTWFIISLICLSGANYDEARAFLEQPINAILMAALIGAGLFHMKLGLQVVVEDYVHGAAAKYICLILNTLGSALLAVAAFYSILTIGLGG